MTLFAFLLGLALGIGIWLWQWKQLQRQQRQILKLLEADAAEVSLPVVSQLRRGIAQAQQHRQELEFQLQISQQILQVAPIGYLQVDEENQLLWCNEQARQMLQIDRWEPGQVRLLLELVRSYELDHLIEQTRHQQNPVVQEWVFHPACSDAAAMSRVPSITLRASSWLLPQGQVGVFLENRQPLVELSQDHNRWVSDLAHELRTPLTSIRLVAEALQTRLELPLRRWVDQLLPEINRLINLIQDWLELSQMEVDPHKHLVRQPLELKLLLISVWETLDPLARQKQLSLTYEGPDTLWLKADASRLTQVFLNLFDNSIKYSPAGGTVRVEVNLIPAAEVAKQVQINIIDAGSGFLESDLPYVFERLYRGDPARMRQSRTSEASENETAKATPGSGLGLAIVRQIILAHSGSVKAQNHPQTGGAWLEIQLPFT